MPKALTNWHAIHVDFRREWSAADALRARGCEAVCPMIETERRVHRRGGRHVLSWVRAPLYPRYILASSHRLHEAIDHLRSRPALAGALRVVRMGDVPSPVRNIAAVLARSVWREETESVAVEYVVGQMVTIDEKAGIYATVSSVEHLESRGYVTVTVFLFGQPRETKLYVAGRKCIDAAVG